MQSPPAGSHVLPTPIQVIVLTGFMGAGKSTVGALLAERLAWTFLDLDAEIEHLAGSSIAEIFRIHGEAHFRAREARTLQSLITRPHTVLALGGGAIESEASRQLLATTPGLYTVYLSAPLEDLIDRCLAQQQITNTIRPVLADRERLHARWSSRLPYYHQAQLCIETQHLTPDQVASNIAASVSALLSPAEKP